MPAPRPAAGGGGWGNFWTGLGLGALAGYLAPRWSSWEGYGGYRRGFGGYGGGYRGYGGGGFWSSGGGGGTRTSTCACRALSSLARAGGGANGHIASSLLQILVGSVRRHPPPLSAQRPPLRVRA